MKEIDYTQTVLEGLLKAKTYAGIMLGRSPANFRWRIVYGIIGSLCDFLEKGKEQNF